MNLYFLLFQFVMLVTTKMVILVNYALGTQSSLWQVMLLTVTMTPLVMELLKSLTLITLIVVCIKSFQNRMQEHFNYKNYEYLSWK